MKILSDVFRLPLKQRTSYELIRLRRAARLVKDRALCQSLASRLQRVQELVAEQTEAAYRAAIHAARCGLAVEPMHAQRTDPGGLKEVAFAVKGSGAWQRFRYESGVHRVQRVPTTEAQGRIHTSTVTVAVLPEPEGVELPPIPAKDLQIDVYRSSGPGGQGVNTTDSAVRIRHLPTGLVVTCQDERSQLRNKDKAMRVLRARLLDQLQRDNAQQIASDRRRQVGGGVRSEKIRTYNFPDRRITDHRIGLTLHKFDLILEGDLQELVDALIEAERAKSLSGPAS